MHTLSYATWIYFKFMKNFTNKTITFCPVNTWKIPNFNVTVKLVNPSIKEIKNLKNIFSFCFFSPELFPAAKTFFKVQSITTFNKTFLPGKSFAVLTAAD